VVPGNSSENNSFIANSPSFIGQHSRNASFTTAVNHSIYTKAGAPDSNHKHTNTPPETTIIVHKANPEKNNWTII
jgi:N-acetylneuraminic acid mutarotase